ncbi:hypothetical protein H4R33_004851 [Dimargaris cristalligena]|nr:hypothetical protein H4R33_004851 [Dimargaris cristalligena]
MGVLVIILEFDEQTISELTDLGPWKHDDIWKIGQSFTEERASLLEAATLVEYDDLPGPSLPIPRF